MRSGKCCNAASFSQQLADLAGKAQRHQNPKRQPVTFKPVRTRHAYQQIVADKWNVMGA
jgi:hypothetical protein